MTSMRLFITALANELRGEGKFLGNCRSAEFIFFPVLMIGLILLFRPTSFKTSFSLQDLVTTTGPLFKTCFALTWVISGILGMIGVIMGMVRAYADNPRPVNVVEKWSRTVSATMSCLLFSYLTFKFYITAPTILPTIPVYIFAVLLSVWNAMLAWNNR